MDQKIIFMTIIGMMVVTYVPRVLPVLALSSKELPPMVVKWLSYIPSAVLSALLLPSLVAPDKVLNFGLDNIFLWVAFPTFIVAALTRNFFGTVATGMGLVALARFFM